MKLSGLPLNRSHTPTPCLTKDTAQSTAAAGQWGQEMWKVPPDGPYWERFDRLGLSNDPLRPYFLPNDLLGRRGFNLREYFSLDNDPSGEVTPHTISNTTENLRTLSATSNTLYNLFRLIWKPRSPASLAVCTSRWNIVILSLLSFNSYTIFLGQ